MPRKWPNIGSSKAFRLKMFLSCCLNVDMLDNTESGQIIPKRNFSSRLILILMQNMRRKMTVICIEDWFVHLVCEKLSDS